MARLQFRDLKADEIDCRISTISEKGLSLLLYKDARCDMNILDETVGSYNWQRSHSRDNANCTVSIWDEDKKQWIGKEDVGTESNTEAVKGLASDSFKRACFNWGIGRELYTAPFIWIKAADCTITKNNNGKWISYDKFCVSDISIKDKKIVSLTIYNISKQQTVFTYGKSTSKNAKANKQEPAPVVPAEEEKSNREKLRDYIAENKPDKAKVVKILNDLKIDDNSPDSLWGMALAALVFEEKKP